MRRLMIVVACMATLFSTPLWAQDDRPSWRTDAELTRPEALPEIERPEFEFSVDKDAMFSREDMGQPVEPSVGSAPARADVEAPELGRVASWRERVLSSDSPAESNSEPESSEPAIEPEPATIEPQQIARVDPPAPVVDVVDEPAVVKQQALAPGEVVLRPISRVEPDFPREAYLDRREGWVDIEMTVAADGSVVSTRVVDAEPRRLFEKAALRAADGWIFNAPGSEQKTVMRFDFTL